MLHNLESDLAEAETTFNKAFKFTQSVVYFSSRDWLLIYQVIWLAENNLVHTLISVSQKTR